MSLAERKHLMGIHTENPVNDAHLTQALAEVMGHLRKRQYGVVLGHFEDALRGSADAFVDSLARHLIHEEHVLFPALRRLDPETAKDVGVLQKEHAHLRELAAEMARSVKAGDAPKAYDVARTFLAELYGHIGREASVADRLPPAETPSPPQSDHR
jgi:hemerythrin-like domain-containing protein